MLRSRVLQQFRKLINQWILTRFAAALWVSIFGVGGSLLYWIPWTPIAPVLADQFTIRQSPMNLLLAAQAEVDAKLAEEALDWGSARVHWQRAFSLNPGDEKIVSGWIRSVSFPPLTRERYLRLIAMMRQALKSDRPLPESIQSQIWLGLERYRDFDNAHAWAQACQSGFNIPSHQWALRIAKCHFWKGEYQICKALLRQLIPTEQIQEPTLTMDLQREIAAYSLASEEIIRTANGSTPQEYLEWDENNFNQLASNPLRSVDISILRVHGQLAFLRQDSGAYLDILERLKIEDLDLITDYMPLWILKQRPNRSRNLSLNQSRSEEWSSALIKTLINLQPFSQRELSSVREFFEKTEQRHELISLLQHWMDSDPAIPDSELQIALLETLITCNRWTDLRFATARLRASGAIGSHFEGLADYLDGLACYKTGRHRKAAEWMTRSAFTCASSPEIGLHVFRGMWENQASLNALQLMTSLEKELSDSEEYWIFRLAFHYHHKQGWEFAESFAKWRQTQLVDRGASAFPMEAKNPQGLEGIGATSRVSSSEQKILSYWRQRESLHDAIQKLSMLENPLNYGVEFEEQRLQLCRQNEIKSSIVLSGL